MIEGMDEATLVAYVDGELDARRRREVERRLREDADAQAKVRLMERSARMLRGAYDEVLDLPLPARLERFIEAVRPAASRGADVGPWWRRLGAGLGPGAPLSLAFAAVAVGALVLGVIVGRLETEPAPAFYAPASVGASGLTESQITALETGAAGVAVAYERADVGVHGTFTPLVAIDGPDGLDCRGFRDEVVHPGVTIASVGVACRGAGGWVTLALPAAPRD